jgi:hypothetical protein
MTRAQNSNNILPISAPHRKKLPEGCGALCDGLVAIAPDQALDVGFDRNASHGFMQDAQSGIQSLGTRTSLPFKELICKALLRSRTSVERGPNIRQRFVKILTTLTES